MPALARLLLGCAAAGLLTQACLVRRSLPGGAPPTAAHETRRRLRADGTPESEVRLLVLGDGRVERDGPEREYHPDGRLAAERWFARGEPTGTWRTFDPDGTPRSELDFGAPGSREPRLHRYWHANGALAAEGPAAGGVREGRWSFFAADGRLLQVGSYRAGQRDGLWAFYGEAGTPRAEGVYALGERVGSWTLWDEDGRPHSRPAGEWAPDGA